MDIEVGNRKLKASLENDAICVKRFGKPMAKYIRIRMDALQAAESLFDFWPPKSKPERVHELGGNLSGHFSVDLKQPYRLLFIPIFDGHMEFANEQQRWQQIKRIEILRIEDTHG